MDCQWIKVRKDHHNIARLTLSRPEKRNALNGDMITALKEHFQHWHDEIPRAVVVDAQGDVFCAGADIEWMRNAATFDHEKNIKDAGELGALIRLFYQLPCPTLVLVQGAAYGGALGLVAASDMAICTTDSVFCLSEVRLGLIPALISPYIIQAVGQRQALKHTLTAEIISAGKACELGLVHEVVERSHLSDKGEGYLKQVIKGCPASQCLAKSFMREISQKSLTDELIDHTVQTIARERTSAHGQEGTRAFIEKRQPDWSL